MIWYSCMYFIGLCGVAALFINQRKARNAVVYAYLAIFALALCVFAGLRSSGVDRDYLNYVRWFDRISSNSMEALSWFKSPAFVIVSHIVSVFGGGFVFVALIFAGLALALKICFAEIAMGGRWMTLLFYLIVCHTFLVDEMTEIRAAVAIPLMTIAIIMANRGKKWRAVALFIIALTFHLSALIGLPVLLAVLVGIKFESRWWIVSLIPLAVIVMIVLNRLLLMIAVFGRLTPYLNGPVDTGPIHYLSIFLWAQVGILVVLMAGFWSRMTADERLAAFCAGAGLFVLLVLHANDNIALRASGVFELFDLLLFMIPLKYMRGNLSRLAYAGMLLIFGVALFWASLKVVGPYHWVLA